jgi:YVTN family beta-propeller protein
MDANTLYLITKIPLPNSGFQIDITKYGSLAFVSLHQSGQVAVVDLNVNLVIKVIESGSGAEDVKISPTSPLVFISNEFASNLTPVNIDLAEPAITPIATGSAPVGLAFNSSGRKLYVANRNNDTVSVIDVFTHREITKIKVGNEPYGAAATCGGRLVIITNFSGNNLSVIDTKIDKVIHTAPTGVGPAFLAILKKTIHN